VPLVCEFFIAYVRAAPNDDNRHALGLGRPEAVYFATARGAEVTVRSIEVFYPASEVLHVAAMHTSARREEPCCMQPCRGWGAGKVLSPKKQQLLVLGLAQVLVRARSSV
jgi:hypothetical protein